MIFLVVLISFLQKALCLVKYLLTIHLAMIERRWTSTGLGCDLAVLQQCTVNLWQLPTSPRDCLLRRLVEWVDPSIQGVSLLLTYLLRYDSLHAECIGGHCYREGGVRHQWRFGRHSWQSGFTESFAYRWGNFAQSASSHCCDQS